MLLFFLPGLYNFLPPDSREFEDLVKTVSSCYLDPSSRGTFTYCKARLIRNELLEKEVGCQSNAFVFCFVFCLWYASYFCVSHLLWNPFICQFIEKRREMKQEGRTEQELSESFCFLFPDKSKVLMKKLISSCPCLVLWDSTLCFSSDVCSSSGSVKRVWLLDIQG